MKNDDPEPSGAPASPAGLTEPRAQRWLGEAEGYMQLGLFDLSLERIRAVEASGLLPFECAALRGSILREKEGFAEAIPYFETALRLRPGDLLATVGLGWCQKRVGRVDLAAKAYVEALKVHPDEAILYFNLACYLSLLGQAKESVEALRRTFRIDKDFRELLRDEEDFDPIRAHPEFLQLIGELSTFDKPEKK
ncbi:MAG: tetratricopeptide repeat protein [Planctomycetota bacterium]|nr:tetratricopeptide repeat protein [Planctomycetota bacterium]